MGNLGRGQWVNNYLIRERPASPTGGFFMAKGTKTDCYIFDFDSTFVTVETLDVLAKIALENKPDKEKRLAQIEEITRLGMEGKLTFDQSLAKRLHLFTAHKSHLEELITLLKKKVSPSIKRNKQFFKRYNKNIYIVSGGFKEYIDPIVKPYGIANNHVLANTFHIDTHGNICGFDRSNTLANRDGKIKALKALGLKGNIYIIGDGYTDLAVRKAGLADEFFAFIENTTRPMITKQADTVLPNLDEFLYVKNLPRSISYPKNRIRILLLDHIDQQAQGLLINEGFPVEVIDKPLSENELTQKLSDISILGVRTKTKITQNILYGAKKLLAIGAFCIGTDHIDLTYCKGQGIAVFNAPFSNTRSVVELALAEIILLSRNVIDKHMKLKQGIWDKSILNSHEVRGKTLGIIGYGHIGSQLSILAEQLGMQVIYFDLLDQLPLGNAKKCATLRQLFGRSDIISIHVTGGKANKHILGEREFSQMKPGVIILNLSRGSVIDTEALVYNLKNGKVAGAGIDVFTNEPKSNDEAFVSELQGLPNVLLTPHIGGSTQEAQRDIAQFVSDKLIQFINTGSTMMSVNVPNLRLPDMKRVHRFIHIHKNVPGVLAQINNTMAQKYINIVGQYLGTNEDIGLCLTDVNKRYDQRIIEKLRAIPETIRLRVLY